MLTGCNVVACTICTPQFGLCHVPSIPRIGCAWLCLAVHEDFIELMELNCRHSQIIPAYRKIADLDVAYLDVNYTLLDNDHLHC